MGRREALLPVAALLCAATLGACGDVSLSEALGEPTYNFNKYLLDRRGSPVEHFDQSTEPDDPELVAAIESQL